MDRARIIHDLLPQSSIIFSYTNKSARRLAILYLTLSSFQLSTFSFQLFSPMSHDITAIKDRLDLMDIFRRDGHAPRRMGASLFVPCPFHEEKTPSCKVEASASNASAAAPVATC